MRERRIKALPVIDAQRRIVGILTVADLMREANPEHHQRLGKRLRALWAGKARRVGQIMTRRVRWLARRRR
jgi:CBS domain-containing membrane protein